MSHDTAIDDTIKEEKKFMFNVKKIKWNSIQTSKGRIIITVPVDEAEEYCKRIHETVMNSSDILRQRDAAVSHLDSQKKN